MRILFVSVLRPVVFGLIVPILRFIFSLGYIIRLQSAIVLWRAVIIFTSTLPDS